MSHSRLMNLKDYLKLSMLLLLLAVGVPSKSDSRIPLIHDVPAFHNDDGLGLLQDCTFMRAIANGTISEFPSTVAGRSTACLTSIKSVAQVLQHLQTTSSALTNCVPPIELNWLEILDYVTNYMESQSTEALSKQPYGVWIMQALQEKFPCK